MALKNRQMLVNEFTLPVGATAIADGSVCSLSSSALVVTSAAEDFTGVVVDGGTANGNARMANVGSIVLMNAHDDAITENEWVVSAAAGRVDGAAALTGGTQYIVGKALQASSAQDQKIAVWYLPHIATDAAS